MQEINLIRRAVEAHKDGRLLSAAIRRIRRVTIDAEPVLRLRLGLPDVGGCDLPAIVTSGDFSNSEGRALKEAIKTAIDGRSKLPIRAIKGMPGQRYRTLINTLIETLDRPHYLEIGSWVASTAAAAICGNSVLAVCIDNWSRVPGTKEQFLADIEKAKSRSNELRLIERDFRNVDFRTLGKFNVYLFDGPHSEVDHRDGILVPQPCLDERFVLIVDDWNWREVRLGTMRGLLAAKCRVESSVQVRTTNDNTRPSLALEASDWHNGYFIAVVRKRRW